MGVLHVDIKELGGATVCVVGSRSENECNVHEQLFLVKQVGKSK